MGWKRREIPLLERLRLLLKTAQIDRNFESQRADPRLTWSEMEISGLFGERCEGYEEPQYYEIINFCQSPGRAGNFLGLLIQPTTLP